MQPIRKTAHSPAVGYVIDSHRYFTVAEATRIVGSDRISEGTMWDYAKLGFDPSSGLDLGVIRFPLLRTSPNKPRSDRQYRYLLREDRLLILRDVLQECKPHRGKPSQATLADMRDAAARRLRSARPLSAINLG